MRTRNAAIAIDPICGMQVGAGENAPRAEYQGKVYHFCAECCRQTFLKNPTKHAKAAAKVKGWWRRYLERVARANQEVFGAAGPRCH